MRITQPFGAGDTGEQRVISPWVDEFRAGSGSDRMSRAK